MMNKGVSEQGRGVYRKNVECMWALWTWRKRMIGLMEKHYGKYLEYLMGW